VRPSFLRSSAEVLEIADGDLKLIYEKTTRADELMEAIRVIVDPVMGKILKLKGACKLPGRSLLPLAPADVPDLERTVGRNRGQPAAIGTPGQCPYLVSMSAELYLDPALRLK
jgi:hypothetical protein